LSEEPTAVQKKKPVNDDRQLDLELFRGWLDVQRQEIEARREEVGIQRQQIDVNREGQVQAHQYAMAALKAQQEDRSSGRQFAHKKSTSLYFFLAFFIVCFLTFAGVALYCGKDAIVLEILKDLTIFAGGGGTGYAIGTRKKRDPDSSESGEGEK
jgi:hypothetical protein